MITMAGLGSRFSKEGYSIPKYKVMARGRTLFEWSMLSLQNFFDQPFVFATLDTEDHDWLIKIAKSLGIKDCVVHTRPKVSCGQAETAFDALDMVSPHEALWIYNIDTYVECGLHPNNMTGFDGCVPVFLSGNPGMSFVRFDAHGEVVQVAEKEVISNWATVGLYGFSTVELYRSSYLYLYRHGKEVVRIKEQYIAPLYQHMMTSGHRLSAPLLEANEVHVLGTPKEVLAYDSEAHPPTGGRDPLAN
jgi:NDP-sugar pyrophosphorylase family protein